MVDAVSTWELNDALSHDDREVRRTNHGVVTQIDDDGQIWVRLAGADEDTPIAQTTVSVDAGDSVTVRIQDGRAYIDGSTSNPSASSSGLANVDGKAIQALTDAATAAQAALEAVADAATARQSATEAMASAETAQEAAEDAQESADAAQDAADAANNNLRSVVQGATTVEKAVSVMQTALEAVVDYDPTTDTTQEWFWHDANGAHVLGDTSGYRNDITSSGMDIRQVSTEDSVASFGANGWQVGLDDESHMVGDYHSLQLFDKEGNTYFHVSDLRDASGYATMTETFTGDGTTTDFTVSFSVQSEISATDSSDPNNTATRHDGTYSFANAPADGATVTISYRTGSMSAKAYTLGIRASGSVIGGYSVAEGYDSTASGSYSHAEGYHPTASGLESHAEGCSTRASGSHSHAEGYHSMASGSESHAEGDQTFASGSVSHAEGGNTLASGSGSHAEGDSTTASGVDSHAEGRSTNASGSYSHAQNLRTIAKSSSQTALGKYNVEDANDTYAVIVGNGTSTNTRSNALTVDWDGNVVAAGGLDLGTPLAIADGGTGATTASGARANLGVPGLAAANVFTEIQSIRDDSIDRDASTIADDDWATRYLRFQDKDGEVIGVLRNAQRTTGRMDTFLYVYNENTAGDGQVDNFIRLSVARDGTRTYAVADPSAFRNALGINTWGFATAASEATLANSATKAAFTVFNGEGCSLSSNGIKVEQAGWYEISGSFEFRSGFTANDICHIYIRKGSTDIAHTLWRTYTATPYHTITVAPFVAQLAANDVVYMYVYNQTGARGVARAQEANGNGLYVKRLN